MIDLQSLVSTSISLFFFYNSNGKLKHLRLCINQTLTEENGFVKEERLPYVWLLFLLILNTLDRLLFFFIHILNYIRKSRPIILLFGSLTVYPGILCTKGVCLALLRDRWLTLSSELSPVAVSHKYSIATLFYNILYLSLQIVHKL